MSEQDAAPLVEVVPYDPLWPARYESERTEILRLAGDDVLKLEHVGSTAVPGLAAKPIIDMMAAAPDLPRAHHVANRLETVGYALIDTGMVGRLFLRRRAASGTFHLHILEADAWDDSHERIMRDYLLAHPDTAASYGDLKARLATLHAADSLAYTRAKTAFIQDLVDKATTALGRPSITVWPD